MFGWHPRLSVDAFLGTDPCEQGAADHTSYVSKLRERMKYAYKVAGTEAAKVSARNKNRYDRSVRETKLEIGDRVLVRKVGLKGKNKLADKWEQEPYLVINIPNSDIPVYEVQQEMGKGRKRTLHRNMLIYFNSIPLEVPTMEPRCKVKSSKPIPSAHGDHSSGSEDSSESDTDDEPVKLLRSSRKRPLRNTPDNLTTTALEPVSAIAIEATPHEATVVEPEFLNSENVSNVRDQTSQTVGDYEGNSHREPPQGPPILRQSTRTCKQPDRYGQWVFSQQVGQTRSGEIFV
ncbi:uncharacterized protein LOC110442077 [Mizuhopecten yessoensis]|uniref:uncharacterized protein LOC110442077 n=1 Tax=Mizuhopecten yessoensis TaxID=6573 RepID=UPI000B45D2B8|nr:uncharacterized protein LOC110442077 [Mizuhopecten yessoensis]